MRLRPEQLEARLQKGVAPIFFVFGDALLLVQEAAAAIRTAARTQGYEERECLTVEAGFDWNSLLQAGASLSLFGTRRLLELRLYGAKPGDAGGKALRAYAQRPPEDTILLIIADKLDKNAQQSRWFAALDAAGMVVQIRAVEGRQLPVWIERRMRQKGLRPSAEAVAFLAERVEGNLLAAAQEIDKLYLLFGAAQVDINMLLAVVADSARFSIYDLVDAALAAKLERVVRIVYGLRAEGVEAVLASWALHREISLLAQLGFAIDKGLNVDAALNRYKVWETRKPLLRQALGRLPVAVCYRLLRDCARLDRIVKGVEQGDPWEELLNLSLRLAGADLLPVLEVNT